MLQVRVRSSLFWSRGGCVPPPSVACACAPTATVAENRTQRPTRAHLPLSGGMSGFVRVLFIINYLSRLPVESPLGARPCRRLGSLDEIILVCRQTCCLSSGSRFVFLAEVYLPFLRRCVCHSQGSAFVIPREVHLSFPGKCGCRSPGGVIAVPWGVCLPLLWKVHSSVRAEGDLACFILFYYCGGL